MRNRSLVELAVLSLVTAVTFGLGVGVYFVTAGVSAKPRPGKVETFVARSVRKVAIGWHATSQPNPVPDTADSIASGRAHFADHCAVCHANDGSGDTEMGRGLYPKAPDLRLPATQKLEDYELFYIIENGIRLTGMPGWGTGSKSGEDESWRLVRFIRHLPHISPEEVAQMKDMNPQSPEAIRQQIEEEKFLSGVAEEPHASTSPSTHPH